MKKIIYVTLFLSCCFYQLNGQIGRLALSPLQKLEQKIGLTDITIVYSRPSMRGRDIFGGLVPYKKLWRTGANRNTTIEFSKEVFINKKRIKEGKYAIFSIPNPDQWEIIFYEDTNNWDVPEVLDSNKIVSTIIVKTNQKPTPQEVLKISIDDFTNYAFEFSISWSNTSVSIPVELTTKEDMDAKINKTLSGPDYDDYYAAAVYQMESGKEYEKGLTWINKGIAITDKVTWWDLRVKAILLMELGRSDEALKLAKEGLIMAEQEKRSYGINEFKKIIKKVNK